MVKRVDGRSLDAATLAPVRRTVVQAVRGGLTHTAAAKLFGVSVRAVNKWMATSKEGGLRALNAKPRGRPAGAGALTPAQ
ncbi:MAG: helix-turn-helix domain-containing protein, partial [Gemmatimonadaceae bacterium]